jgi:hypothetical protein
MQLYYNIDQKLIFTNGKSDTFKLLILYCTTYDLQALKHVNFEIVHNYNSDFFQSETSVSQDDPVFEKKCSGLVSSAKKDIAFNIGLVSSIKNVKHAIGLVSSIKKCYK